MLLNLLGLAALIFFAYVFFTLFLRSLRSHNLAAKLFGGLVTGLLTLAFVAGTAAAFFGMWKVAGARDRPVADVQVAPTPELVAQGQALAQPCIPCHSADGTPILNGGMNNLAAALGPYGELYGPNLTPGGDIGDWTDGEIIRAIREGVDDQGVPLMVHPARDYYDMSDADAAALVAYLRSQPALRHDQPRRNVNLLAALAVAAGLLPTSEQPPLPAPTGGG